MKHFKFVIYWKKDRFCSKFVSSGLDKHASLNKRTRKLTAEAVYYESAIFFIVQAPGLLKVS
jgi:hypothetical protein